MARRSFTDLLEDADPQYFKDQGKPPKWVEAQIRLIRDFMDTMQPGYGVMLIEGDQTQDFTPTPAILTAWTDAPIVTAEFSADPVLGTITVNVPMVVRFTMNLTVELGNAEEAISTIERQGSAGPAVYTASVQGRGNGKPVALELSALFDIPEPETFHVLIANESGNDTYTFKSGALVAQYIPLIVTPVPPVTKIIP